LAGNAYPAFTDYDHLPQELPDTDIFVGYSLRPQQLKLAKNLKWLHSTLPALPSLCTGTARLRNRRHQSQWHFFCSHGEHTMGLLIALARNFPDSVRYQDNSRFGASRFVGPAATLTEFERSTVANCGIWLDRARTCPPRPGL